MVAGAMRPAWCTSRRIRLSFIAVLAVSTLVVSACKPSAASCYQIVASRGSFYASSDNIGSSFAFVPGAGVTETSTTVSTVTPAWSTDGRLARYDGVARQWIISDVAGTVVASFAGEVADYSDVAWSPDNTRLLYTVGTTYTAAGMAVVAADGKTPPVPVAVPTANRRLESHPEWSPDSRSLAWVTGPADLSVAPHPYDVVVGPADGSTSRVLWSTPDAATAPTGLSWSRTGRLAWAVDGRLYVTGPGGANVAEVPLEGYTQPRRPRWSPDGTRLALAARTPGGERLISITPAGRDVRDLTPDPLPAPPPLPDGWTFVEWTIGQFTWSPTGERVAWSLIGETTGSSGLGFYRPFGWTKADTSGDRQLGDPFSTWDLALDWSPDGQWLAYSSNTNGAGIGTIQSSYTRVFATVIAVDGSVSLPVGTYLYLPTWNPAKAMLCRPRTTNTTINPGGSA